MTDTNYISVADTAKIIRKALKESFPCVKFSVRSKSYSGGASINISWIDGPCVPLVESIAHVFEGATFDGMTDYKGGCVHEFNGETVHFGADFIFCEREKSDSLIQKAINYLARQYGDDNLTIEDYRTGNLYNKTPINNAQGEMHWSWQEIISRDLYKRTDRFPLKSPTAASVQLVRTY